jgi:hypothetical protein
MARLLSYSKRPVHRGSYPQEKLASTSTPPLIGSLSPETPLPFRRPNDPLSIVNAMQEYQAMLDATRDGLVKKEPAEIPDDLLERSNHLKSFGYYCDASMVGICEIPTNCWRDTATENPDVARLAEKIRTMQPKSLATGIDLVMAGLRESMRAPPTDCRNHTMQLLSYTTIRVHQKKMKPVATGWMTRLRTAPVCVAWRPACR